MKESTLVKLISLMKTPIKNIPLKMVIQILSGYKVLPFKKTRQNSQVLNILNKVAKDVMDEVNKVGITKKRINEVGNAIEVYVKKSLIKFGYIANSPFTAKNKSKSTGYPDLEFIDNYNRINYLECKCYSYKTINSTHRTFYVSPSTDFKVTTDAHHLMISFEVYLEDEINKPNTYNILNWKILSLENLTVDIKYEFNSNNRRLYKNNNNLLLESSNKSD